VHDKNRSVAINFCGGCKPIINRRGIALDIETTLAARGILVTFNDWNAEFIVRLSGCSVGCASKYHASGRPGPVIAGTTFDHASVDEPELASRAVAAFDAIGARSLLSDAKPNTRTPKRTPRHPQLLSTVAGNRNDRPQHQS
jgi:hypothetical protein